jgi:hypothetical protein
LAPAQEADEKPEKSSGLLERLWLSGQVNIIVQGHPAFHSPYGGPNSFQAATETKHRGF